MLQPDGFNNSNVLGEGYPHTCDNPEDFTIDIESFYAILEEQSNPSDHYFPSSPEDFSLKNLFQSQTELAPIAVNHEKATQPENGFQESVEASPAEAGVSGSPSSSSSFYLGASDSGVGMGFECMHGSPGNFSSLNETYSALPLQEKLGMPMQIDSKTSLGSGTLDPTFQFFTQSYSEHDPFPRDSAGSSMNAPISNSTDNQLLRNETTNWGTLSLKTVGESNHISDCVSSANFMNLDIKKGNGLGHIGGDEYLFQMEVKDSPSDINIATVSPNSTLHKKIIGSSNPLLDRSGRRDGIPCAGRTADFRVQWGNACASVPNSCHADVDGGQVADIIREASGHCTPSSFCSDSAAIAVDAPFGDITFGQFLPCPYFNPLVSNHGQMITCMKDEKQDELYESQSMCSSSKTKLGAQEGTLRISLADVPITDVNLSLQERHYADLNGQDNANFKCETSACCSPVSVSRHSSSDSDDWPVVNRMPIQFLPEFSPFMSREIKEVDMKNEGEGQLCVSHSISNRLVKDIDETAQKNCSEESSHDDDDADICILEEISDPRYPPVTVVHEKPPCTSQRSTFSDPLHLAIGGTRYKANDERLTFRVALQDLSQTKSESTPPDGLLAVPLLKHQRIALSWMVQKETNSFHCSGGILADDQGLGKTISTIALILSERSPSKLSSKAVRQGEFEALNLDDDDDGVLELDGMKHVGDADHVMMNRSQIKRENTYMAGKGRPAAGTLVVCPTSVLRQWAEELHNKVTSKANLSVLVYHGGNRTKDPNELAKHDVVLTTYSIVSMEVPKQPLVDQDDEEKGKTEDHGVPMGPSTGRKRKYPPSSNKKNLKDKKGMDGALLESVGRPLARVGWFRVILDEAQSIKNHRTQVARACWGLRAKRRWCLSGTPIQNAIDDLYSYFRFLRYDPYAVYKSFCSNIKVPINKNPTNGYKKLQAVLKTIMLRRTKGSLLDGEPIINLPPKTVSLKKVDFSLDEREFYSRLEADSRAQFKVYADAGTVKQNYVNILLMLLRLRQACDHPLLVKGYDSNSVWRSSVETAKKLPREEQTRLLNRLEACFAICSICNDPPEDAVVTICGHVFCNQCICEHLTGDESLCPAAHCKDHLSVTSVFSKATLKSSLSDWPVYDCSPDGSGSNLVKTPELSAQSLPDSSKIKAALEILQSLSKPRDCTLPNNSRKTSVDFSICQENTPDYLSEGPSKDMCDQSHLDMGGCPSAPVAEKAIVFSQWTRMLDLLEVPLKNSSIHYRRLDGTMSVVARDRAVKDFNTLPEVSVMIMSLKAASLGLNMVAACHVVLLDLWWNPTTEDQAIDRAHRIGQTRPVTVSRLTVKDTVEDRILALQEKKREMVASAFGEDETGGRQTRLTVEDLEYLFMA
ncbi:helicase-like transcription factor CHR28 [Magnolia sinica]|uniref:helicase-like transcription factor CHR28 n=1 Tax=Magnolia sinica TaxID=86752 RepID=UPI00265A5F3D|nr:helicase-like transcription factor CHR28 [Magnolia sinica]